jgi:predicted membrane-bound spermidine synthase
MNIKLWKLLPLLFVSGFCSLAYQLVWMRELRLVFGSSTMATSAVLAIFMGGIGFGSIYLGRRAEQDNNPLRLYGYFELIIALSAMLTPSLILLVEYLYLKTGGSQSLGFLPATILRLFLSTLVLGVPTFFMGGTLPALAKASLRKIDSGRRDLGFLYGMNTLGAVTGVWLVIFVMLQSFGSHKTLWASGFLNLAVAVMALIIARYDQSTTVSEKEWSPGTASKHTAVLNAAQAPTIPPAYIYGATCLAGFCFFFMELVWYRMLTPLLGGTTYTMGIILAVALLGLAVGSWGYGIRRYTINTSLRILALVCSLEALFMAVPFALGDRIAVLTSLLRPIGTVGMAGYAVGWLCISIIIVLPGSIAAGYQFPLLIGLKGHGRHKVATETGQIYAWNTFGAILGSLLGGMILLPMLGAVPSWQLNIFLLCLLAAASITFSIRYDGRHLFLIIPGCITVLAVLLLLPPGPTDAWRHTPIGAGRADLSQSSHNEIQDWITGTRRYVFWEKDGRENSVAMEKHDGLSFKVNGKVDGNVKSDAGTQIIAPLIGAILHPKPQKALVIGLGTGSSSGWLADVNSITQVDTVEIEPAMLEVAKRSAPVNRDVLKNKKVNIIIDDAREVLLTNRENYDIIFSEPSNPYRAGVASLYTQEFYATVAKRLSPNGYFSQWVQGYEVDTQTIKIIYSTLASVFPVVETWETKMNDLLFICSMTEIDYSVKRLRETIKKEPFRSALLFTHGITDLEGLMTHFVAKSSFARKVATEEKEFPDINTDDNMLVEYGFARALGNKHQFSIMDIRAQAKKRDENHPNLTNGDLDWDLIDIHSHLRFPMAGLQTPNLDSTHNDTQRSHLKAFNLYLQANTRGFLEEWQKYGKKPEYPFEIMVMAESLAQEGHPLTEQYVAALQNYWPLTATAVLSRFYWRTGDRELAYQTMEKVVMGFRTNPWPQKSVMEHSLFLMKEMAFSDKGLAKKIYKLLSEPFSVYNLEYLRMDTLYAVAKNIDQKYMAMTIEQFEPNPPWNEEFLVNRLQAYRQTGNSLTEQAEKDLNIYNKYAPIRFVVDDYPPR